MEPIGVIAIYGHRLADIFSAEFTNHFADANYGHAQLPGRTWDISTGEFSAESLAIAQGAWIPNKAIEMSIVFKDAAPVSRAVRVGGYTPGYLVLHGSEEVFRIREKARSDAEKQAARKEREVLESDLMEALATLSGINGINGGGDLTSAHLPPSFTLEARRRFYVQGVVAAKEAISAARYDAERDGREWSIRDVVVSNLAL